MLLFIMVMALVSVRFHEICRGLYSTGATHDYKMEHLQKSSVMRALYYREWKRYVSSGVYVTNTIIGPFLAVIFACSILVIGMDKLQDSMGIPVDIRGVVPFLLGGIFCVMPTTCTSVSLEGKEWWIVKSLPIKSNELFACKLLMFVSLIAPFYVVSELLLVIALKPDVRELLWLVVIPVVMVVFSGVFGITVNVKLPVFDWENEVAVVKQSASSLLGGIGGMLIVMLCAIPVVLVPALYEDVVKLGICLAIVGVTIVLYRKNSQVNLLEL